ncbi:MAG: hypothetical protein RSJ40_02410 [Acetivibrio sp.]
MGKKAKKIMAVLLCIAMVLPMMADSMLQISAGGSIPVVEIGKTPSRVDSTISNKVTLYYDQNIAKSAVIQTGAIGSTGTSGDKEFQVQLDLTLDEAQLGNLSDISASNYKYSTVFHSTSELKIGTKTVGKLLLPDGTTDIGSFSAAQAATPSAIQVDLTIEGSKIANLSNITAGCKLTLQVSKKAQEGSTPGITQGTGDNALELTYQEVEPPKPVPVYSLTKNGTIKGNEIIYEMIAGVTGDGNVLDEKYIYDQLPGELKYKSGSIVFWDKDGAATGPAITINAPNNLINIGVPSGSAITTAKLTITAELTRESYEKYIQSATTAGIPVKNIAYLYDGDKTMGGTPTVKELKKAENNATFFPDTKFLGKDGKQVGNSGQTMEWELKGNTYFNSGTAVYIVDL